MKLLGYIFTLYMLLLAVFPCCLVDDCPDDKVEQKIAHHQSGDEDCGSCSPFFNCEGCAPVSATVEPVFFNIIYFPAKTIYTGFINPFIPDIQYDFWQPPKLG